MNTDTLSAFTNVDLLLFVGMIALFAWFMDDD